MFDLMFYVVVYVFLCLCCCFSYVSVSFGFLSLYDLSIGVRVSCCSCISDVHVGGVRGFLHAVTERLSVLALYSL